MSTVHTCECKVLRGQGFSRARVLCGKPAKGQLNDGTWACGIHLAQERKAEENKAKYDATQDRKKKYFERLAQLTEKLGFELGPVYAQQFGKYHYNKVTVNINDLLKALNYEE